LKTVHLIRHGETDQNVLKVWQGHTDTSLNQTGLQQANLLASRLKDSNAPVYSSDLKRASETASFLSKKIELRETLREINVGDFTGKSVSQTFSSNNEIFEYLQDKSYQFPNGETVK
jgi:broad specificity phosphatase PhoE